MKKMDCYVLICSYLTYLTVIRERIRQFIKRLENWWLSGPEIRLVAIPYMFPPFSHTFSLVSTFASPVSLGISPCLPWCFSLFFILGLTVLYVISLLGHWCLYFIILILICVFSSLCLVQTAQSMAVSFGEQLQE